MKIAHYTLFSAEGTQIAESLDLLYIKDVAKRQKPGNYYVYEWWADPDDPFWEHCPDTHYEFIIKRRLISTTIQIINKDSLFKNSKL